MEIDGIKTETITLKVDKPKFNGYLVEFYPPHRVDYHKAEIGTVGIHKRHGVIPSSDKDKFNCLIGDYEVMDCSIRYQPNNVFGIRYDTATEDSLNKLHERKNGQTVYYSGYFTDTGLVTNELKRVIDARIEKLTGEINEYNKAKNKI